MTKLLADDDEAPYTQSILLIPSPCDPLPRDFTDIHPTLPIFLMIYSLKNTFLLALVAHYFRIRASTHAHDSHVATPSPYIHQIELLPLLQYDHERTTYTTSTKSTTATTETRKKKQALQLKNDEKKKRKKLYTVLVLTDRDLI